MNDISTNNTEIVLTIGSIIIRVTHFSAEGDIWVPANEPELGGTERTPDGKLISWAKNDTYKFTLTLSGGSPQIPLIMNAFQAQSRNGNIPAIKLPIQAIVSTDRYTTTYVDGTMETGPVAPGIGNQKLMDCAWTFSFDKVITIER